MEAERPEDTKPRDRKEGATKAVQAMHGDSFSTNRVDFDPMCSTRFGVKAEAPALPCRDDVVVENGAAAPKSCLSPSEMRSPTAADGLLPAGMASTTTRTIFNQPTLLFYSTVETNSKRAPIQYALVHYQQFLVEPASYPLLAEGYTNKIKAKSGNRSRRF